MNQINMMLWEFAAFVGLAFLGGLHLWHGEHNEGLVVFLLAYVFLQSAERRSVRSAIDILEETIKRVRNGEKA